MTLELLTLQEADFDTISAIAKEALPYDPISSALVREKILEEPSYEPEMALKAVVDGTIVGFMAGHVDERREHRGAYIKIFAVDEAHRRQGIGSALLEAFEERAKARGAEKIHTLDSIPNYLAPGIDPRYTPATLLFERRGYTKVEENIDMISHLGGLDLDTSALEEKAGAHGLIVRRATEADRDSLYELLDANWKVWRYECDNAYRNDPVSLFLGLEGEKVVAFAAYDGNNRGTGWFGPMGTEPEYRCHKLGEITLKRCLSAIRESGLESSVIPWVGPIGFYSRTVKATIDRVFWVYEKTL